MDPVTIAYSMTELLDASRSHGDLKAARLAATLVMVFRAMENHAEVLAGSGGHSDRLDALEALVADDDGDEG